ncbi:hypothetical protein [Amycolatopsis sp.]|uniref:hypothetical protein n=1 Tax=Amycolatopsis sp. TaxID=37632 RepID=UPI002D80DB3F|nr:hypothetical protein [Amycolatopsis sp.]HET6706273.1 hypothetical protein [Amycolatopsis sp.]
MQWTASDLFALGYGGLVLGLVVVPGLGAWLTGRARRGWNGRVFFVVFGAIAIHSTG